MKENRVYSHVSSVTIQFQYRREAPQGHVDSSLSLSPGSAGSAAPHRLCTHCGLHKRMEVQHPREAHRDIVLTAFLLMSHLSLPEICFFYFFFCFLPSDKRRLLLTTPQDSFMKPLTIFSLHLYNTLCKKFSTFRTCF